MNIGYKTLIISNIAETYYKTYKKASEEEAARRIKYDFLEGERGVLYQSDNKIVITSTPIDDGYLKDLSSILGYRYIVNLYPKKPTERLCQDLIRDKRLFKQLVEILKNNPGIKIIPYFATEDFFDLLTALKQKRLKFSTPESVPPRNRFIRDHFNCKVGFRKLWEQSSHETSFVKIPRGFIVENLKEALDAAWWFYQKRTDFVFKYNRGTSGLGIVFYHCNSLPKKESAFRQYLRQRHRDKIWFEENFVVEEYIDVNKEFYGGSPSVEFRIDNSVKHQYNCFQRLDKNAYFEGVLIAEELEEKSAIDFSRVVDSCMGFGRALHDLGYRGFFDIDLIIDKKNNIYAVESNLRRTGGTHIFELARFLFGRNFIKKVAVASRDNLAVAKEIKTYQELKKRSQHLFFSIKKGEGIIPAIPSFLQIGQIGYIVFGKTVERINQIEAAFKEAVSS